MNICAMSFRQVEGGKNVKKNDQNHHRLKLVNKNVSVFASARFGLIAVILTQQFQIGLLDETPTCATV